MKGAITVWYLAHVFLGAMLGLITSCIFLALYYGTTYDMPVPDSTRIKAAAIATAIIVAIPVIIYFRKEIMSRLQGMVDAHEDE